MRLLFLTLATSFALISMVQAQGDTPGARTIRRTTMPGQEVRIFTYAQHRSDCSPAGDPHITLKNKPAHGTATVRSSTVPIGPSRFGAPDCTGKIMSGLGIWYAPEAGFRGTDQFDYDVDFTNGIAHDTAIIEVK